MEAAWGMTVHLTLLSLLCQYAKQVYMTPSHTFYPIILILYVNQIVTIDYCYLIWVVYRLITYLNTIGDKLRSQSWIFDMLIISVMNSTHWKVKDEA